MWSCAARVVWHCFKRWKTQDAFMRPLPPPPTEPSMGVRVPCRCLRLAWNLVCQWLQWDFWSSWAGGAVPSPLGARHVRGTVVHVPDSPPWRGAAPTLNYGYKLRLHCELFLARPAKALQEPSSGMRAMAEASCWFRGSRAWTEAGKALRLQATLLQGDAVAAQARCA